MNYCTQCSFADTSFSSADLHEFETGHVVLMVVNLTPEEEEVAA